MMRKLGYSMLIVSFLSVFGCKISGSVTGVDGGPVTGVTVSFGAVSIETDAEGDYTSPDLSPLKYTVTPSKEGYTFIPESHTVTIADFVAGNTMGVDFVAASSFTNSAGMAFNLLSAGIFTMGSPTDELGRSSNETQHEVTLTQDFYMQTTEVTQGQWVAILTEAENQGISIGGLSKTPSDYNNCGAADCPVEKVSWDDIQIFIGVLNQLGEGTYALPTEAQWEYAAKAGSTTAFANGEITVAFGGNDPILDLIGWYLYHLDSTLSAHEVAQLVSNDWGLYDMHGNVMEWCQDWYQTDLGSDPVIDPEGPSIGSDRVLRGGSWSTDAQWCRSALRSNLNPGYRNYPIGFRLVLHPGQ